MHDRKVGEPTELEFVAPDKIPYYSDCEPLVQGLGYSLVELVVFKRQATWHIKAVISGAEGVGIADCTRVHRALLPRLEAILSSQDMYVEVTSPGLDRVLKNAAEFSLFVGKQVKVWNTDISDWETGTVSASDGESVTLTTDKGEVRMPYSKIAKAKLSGTR